MPKTTAADFKWCRRCKQLGKAEYTKDFHCKDWKPHKWYPVLAGFSEFFVDSNRLMNIKDYK